MDTITVDKTKLLDTMRANREKHIDIFTKAQEGYREQAIAALDRRLQNARDGKVNLSFSLPEPKNFTEEYDTAIAMLEWSQDDTADLSQHDFERYVQDKWDWARQFVAANSTYTQMA